VQNILLGCLGRMLRWRGTLGLFHVAEKQRALRATGSWPVTTMRPWPMCRRDVQRRILDHPGGGHGPPRAGSQGADGAPTRVLGGAGSGNVVAELAQYDRLGILSRDEYTTGLLQTAGCCSAETTAMICPGEICVGLPADLLRARVHVGQALIRQVWRQAKRVL